MKIIIAIFFALFLCVACQTRHRVSRPAVDTRQDDDRQKLAAEKYDVVVDTRTNIEKLSDKDPAIREIAVAKLGREKNTENIDYLAKMLNDPLPQIRKVTIDSLLQCCSAEEDKTKVAGYALDQLESEKDMGVQITCIIALGKLRSTKAIPKLKLLLKHDYPIIRTYTVKSLGEINDKSTYPLIVDMLKDEAEGVKIQSAQVIGELRIKSGTRELLKYINYPINAVSKEMIKSLGETGTTRIIPKLKKKLKDEDKSIVKATEIAIQKIRKRSSKKK